MSFPTHSALRLPQTKWQKGKWTDGRKAWQPRVPHGGLLGGDALQPRAPTHCCSVVRDTAREPLPGGLQSAHPQSLPLALGTSGTPIAQDGALGHLSTGSLDCFYKLGADHEAGTVSVSLSTHPLLFLVECVDGRLDGWTHGHPERAPGQTQGTRILCPFSVATLLGDLLSSDANEG